MHGNVAEWCRDGYTDKYPPDSEPDPVGPTDAKFHVIRGGSWFYDAKELESGFRAYRGPKSSRNDLGFRVMYR
jgi:formylglycine-generating enzyme required for sulfatase activity